MSALEREIIEKFQRLEPAVKQCVLKTLTLDAHSTFDYDRWWATVDALQTKIRAQLGAQGTVRALALLDELREEES